MKTRLLKKIRADFWQLYNERTFVVYDMEGRVCDQTAPLAIHILFKPLYGLKEKECWRVFENHCWKVFKNDYYQKYRPMWRRPKYKKPKVGIF